MLKNDLSFHNHSAIYPPSVLSGNNPTRPHSPLSSNQIPEQFQQYQYQNISGIYSQDGNHSSSPQIDNQRKFITPQGSPLQYDAQPTSKIVQSIPQNNQFQQNSTQGFLQKQYQKGILPNTTNAGTHIISNEILRDENGKNLNTSVISQPSIILSDNSFLNASMNQQRRRTANSQSPQKFILSNYQVIDPFSSSQPKFHKKSNSCYSQQQLKQQVCSQPILSQSIAPNNEVELKLNGYNANEDIEKRLKELIVENKKLITENQYFKQYIKDKSPNAKNQVDLEQQINALTQQVQQLQSQLVICNEDIAMWKNREYELADRSRSLFDQLQIAKGIKPHSPSQPQIQIGSKQQFQPVIQQFQNQQSPQKKQNYQISPQQKQQLLISPNPQQLSPVPFPKLQQLQQQQQQKNFLQKQKKQEDQNIYYQQVIQNHSQDLQEQSQMQQQKPLIRQDNIQNDSEKKSQQKEASQKQQQLQKQQITELKAQIQSAEKDYSTLRKNNSLGQLDSSIQQSLAFNININKQREEIANQIIKEYKLDIKQLNDQSDNKYITNNTSTISNINNFQSNFPQQQQQYQQSQQQQQQQHQESLSYPQQQQQQEDLLYNNSEFIKTHNQKMKELQLKYDQITQKLHSVNSTNYS